MTEMNTKIGEGTSPELGRDFRAVAGSHVLAGLSVLAGGFLAADQIDTAVVFAVAAGLVIFLRHKTGDQHPSPSPRR